MSKSYEDFCNAHRIQDRVCAVAYTLDDTQPVLCTHIGDQPLFYLDEPEIEDEDFFTAEELEAFSEEMLALNREVTSFNPKMFATSEHAAALVCDFVQNADSFAAEFSLTAQEKEERINKIIEILSESRLASAYLSIAEEYDVKFEMSEQVEKAFYDRRSGTILLYPNMDLTDHVLLAARELRRHWQHRQGVLINPLKFQPENAVLINRAQDADLSVSVIRTAWELQLAGIKDVWERVENSPLSDLARAFAREAFLDFRTINNGVACAAVFEAWFLSERCRLLDRKIIQCMLADYNGYVFDNETSSNQITTELIATLGSMPFGKNYLAIHASVIMEDPIFVEVRDRSNANFLWFIKFERSFKETEQELQTDSDLSTHDIRHELLNEKSQDQNHEQQTTADIIQLFGNEAQLADAQNRQSLLTRSKSRNEKQSRSADVIELKHWADKQSI